MQVWHARRAYRTVTYTELYKPDVLLLQLTLLMMSTMLLETRREWKQIYIKGRRCTNLMQTVGNLLTNSAHDYTPNP